MHEASFVISDRPAAYSQALSDARASLARVASAQAGDDEDYADDLEHLTALASAAVAAERSAREVGRLLLAEGVVDSADDLALAAIEGDPVAAAISRFHHGSQPVSDALDEQRRHGQAVVDAFNAWRSDPSEEREDDLADAAERLRTDISTLHDELIAPALNALSEAVTRIAPQSSGSAVQQKLSDDLADIRNSLASIEQAVRSWNYRRSDDNPEGRGWNVPAFCCFAGAPTGRQRRNQGRLESRGTHRFHIRSINPGGTAGRHQLLPAAIAGGPRFDRQC